MALLNNVPPPFGDPIANRLRPGFKPGTDPQEGLMGQAWTDYFTAQQALLQRMPGRVFNKELPGRTGSIITDDLTNGGVSATGLYRLTYFLHVTTGDNGGTLVVTLSWVSEGATLSFVSRALGTDDDSFYQSAGPGDASDPGRTGPGLIYIDGLSPVTYAINYVPFAGGVVYSFRAVLEEVMA